MHLLGHWHLALGMRGNYERTYSTVTSAKHSQNFLFAVGQETSQMEVSKIE